MPGSMREKKDGVWEIVIEAGYDGNGKRIRKYHTFHGGSRAAEKEMRRLISDYEQGNYIEPSKMKFSEFLEYWLKHYAEAKTEPKTYACYKKIIEDHITPKLGKIKLSELRLYNIQDYCDNLCKEGRKDGKKGGLAPTSIIKHFRIIHRALNYAVTKEMLPRNPATGIELPSKKKPKYRVLTLQEINILVDHANWKDEREDFCRIADLTVHTGLRRSEILGLRESDIDFTKMLIKINQTISYTKAKGVFIKDTAKNEESEGIVTIGIHEIEIINQQLLEQKKKRIKAGELWTKKIAIESESDEPKELDNDLLFTQDNGKPIFPDTITSWWPDFCKRHDLPRTRFHDLRHSHGTLLLEAGEPLSAVSERLRHAEKSTTLNIYSHVLNSTQRRLADTLTNLRRSTDQQTDQSAVNENQAQKTDTSSPKVTPITGR